MPNENNTKSLEGLATMAFIESLVKDRVEAECAEKFESLQREREKHLQIYAVARADIDKRLSEMDALIRSGFPDGDPVSHCHAHEAYISEANERGELVKTAKRKAVDLGTYGILMLIGYAVWDYIKAKLGAK